MITCRKCGVQKNSLEYNHSRLKKHDYMCRICEKEYNCNYRINNKEKILNKRKNYRINNIDKIKKNQFKYTSNNKDKKRIYDRIYRKLKRKNPIEKIKNYISRSINLMLNNKRSNKNKLKILNYVPWTLIELKTHIESLFESWMNWNNQGVYKVDSWNDEDQTTWVWHLDHIVPHSHFKYESMDCEEFRQCWSLNNLRPYSAKKNVLEGNRR